MVPSWPQEGTPSNLPSQMRPGGPPLASTFLSLPSAANPINRLSGDQNGEEAPSVPARASGCEASSDLSQSCVRPSVVTTNATCRPSGERARSVLISCGTMTPPAGSGTDNRMTSSSELPLQGDIVTAPAATTVAIAAAVQASAA